MGNIVLEDLLRLREALKPPVAPGLGDVYGDGRIIG
jgi:hypothetical protein